MSFREIGTSAKRAIYRQVGNASSQIQRYRSLPVDLLESEGAYLVVFDAPGAERSDVQIRYLDGSVRFRVDRFRRFYDGFEMRYPGRSTSLDGTVALPEDGVVDPEAATARLTDDGTITIEIPKDGAPAGEVEQIEIEAEPRESTPVASGDPNEPSDSSDTSEIEAPE